MKVILLQDTAKLGKRGSVVEVADGYAINVLIKQGKALQATPQELTKWKQAADKKEREKDTARKAFYELSSKLVSHIPVVTVLKHDNGHLFAAISPTQIADAIFVATNVSIDPMQLSAAPIKMLGDHEVTLKVEDKKIVFIVKVQAKK